MNITPIDNHCVRCGKLISNANFENPSEIKLELCHCKSVEELEKTMAFWDQAWSDKVKRLTGEISTLQKQLEEANRIIEMYKDKNQNQ